MVYFYSFPKLTDYYEYWLISIKTYEQHITTKITTSFLPSYTLCLTKKKNFLFLNQNYSYSRNIENLEKKYNADL